MALVLEEWQGGKLRVFAPQLDGSRHELKAEWDCVPLRTGWAISKHGLGPQTVGGFRGVRLVLEVVDGDLRCTAVQADEITSSLLRRLEPKIADEIKLQLAISAVRLFELDDGTIAGELPWGSADRPPPPPASPAADAVDFIFGPAGDFYDTTHAGPGKPPLTAEHLETVARLYWEAKQLKQPAAPYIAERVRGYSHATIRGWIRKAKQRGVLGDTPTGAQPANKPNDEKEKR